MAHTIDHEEEIYKTQKAIEKRDSRHLNTGKKHKPYAAKLSLLGNMPGETTSTKGQEIATGLVKSILPDPTDPKEVAEFFVDAKMAMKVPGHPLMKGGAVLRKRAAREILPTLEEVLEPVMRGFRGPQWQPAFVDAGTGGIVTKIPTDVKPTTSFQMSRLPNTENLRQEVITVSDEYIAIPKGTKITNKVLDEQLLLRQKAEKLLAEAGPNPSSAQMDKIRSMKSTTTEILPNDPAFYSNQSVAMKAKYTQYEDTVNKLGTLQWHHKTMKAVSSPFLDRAWDIVRNGGGTQADILNLHQMALNHGVGMGDRMSALLPMGRVPHQKLHNWAKATGIQPTPAQIKEITEKLKGVDNMEDLTRLFNKELETIAKPMTREAEIMQKVWMDVGTSHDHSELARLFDKRNKASKALSLAKKQKKSAKEIAVLEKAKEAAKNEYYALKNPMVDEFFKNRPKYGNYTDAHGNLIQDQWGQAEMTLDKAIDALHKQAEVP